MLPLAAAIPLAVAGAQIVGGMIGNEQNARNIDQANKDNKWLAQEQMQFQERMSNSAYQRAMADMKQAGLNPMLAYQQGGASSPAGTSATMQAAKYEDPIGPAAASAADAYSKTASIENAKTGLAQQAEQIGIQKANSEAEIAMKAAQTAHTTASAKNLAVQGEILRARAAEAKLDGDFYSSDKGKMFYQLDKINQAVGGSLDTANSALSIINPFKNAKKILQQNKQQKGTGTMKDGTRFNLETGQVID